MGLHAGMGRHSSLRCWLITRWRVTHEELHIMANMK